jgi:hypothetical protein
MKNEPIKSFNRMVLYESIQSLFRFKTKQAACLPDEAPDYFVAGLICGDGWESSEMRWKRFADGIEGVAPWILFATLGILWMAHAFLAWRFPVPSLLVRMFSSNVNNNCY